MTELIQFSYFSTFFTFRIFVVKLIDVIYNMRILLEQSFRSVYKELHADRETGC